MKVYKQLLRNHVNCTYPTNQKEEEKLIKKNYYFRETHHLNVILNLKGNLIQTKD